jgi:hypothetical protein
VFLADHWHAICAPQYPLTTSEVMESIKKKSTTHINRGRVVVGRVLAGPFFGSCPATREGV